MVRALFGIKPGDIFEAKVDDGVIEMKLKE